MKEARKHKKLQIRIERGEVKQAEVKAGKEDKSNKTKFAPTPVEEETEALDAKAKRTRKKSELSLGEAPAENEHKKKKVKLDEAEFVEEPPKAKKANVSKGSNDTAVNREAGSVESADPEAFKVVVAGFNRNLTEVTLRRDFTDCGEILNLRLLRDKETQQSRCIAFISFTSQEAVDIALKYDGEDYGGRTLLVQVAEKSSRSSEAKGNGKGKNLGEKPEGCTSVILKGLAFSVTEADLKRTFEECGDGPTNINILTEKETGKSRGMAFVDFDDEAAVDEAAKLNGTELKGRRFSLDYATPREKSKGPGVKPEGCMSVVVKGLDYSVTSADLERTFEACGNGPTNVRIAMDKKTGLSRGIAFLDFGSDAAVDQAAKLHRSELKGRRFIVDYAAVDQGGAEEAAAAKVKGLGKKPSGCTSIMVKGLAAEVTEAVLLKTFKRCGSGPRSANLATDMSSGEPNGEAFVNFWSEDAVDAAVKLNGTEVKGQIISMGYVKPKPRAKA